MTADPSLIFSAPIVSGSGAARKQNCSAELLGMAIYGDYRHGWRLPCIDPAAQRLVVSVQDRLSDEVRNSRRWRLLIARLSTCHNTGNDRVLRRMALWAARSVEHLSADPRVKACNDALERWIAGEATDAELKAAAATAAATAATTEAAWAAWAAWGAEAATATATATATAATAATATATATAGAEAAATVTADRDEALCRFTDDYLTAWLKVAADEGCLIPDEADKEYLDFLAALDFMEGSQANGS